MVGDGLRAAPSAYIALQIFTARRPLRFYSRSVAAFAEACRPAYPAGMASVRQTGISANQGSSTDKEVAPCVTTDLSGYCVSSCWPVRRGALRLNRRRTADSSKAGSHRLPIVRTDAAIIMVGHGLDRPVHSSRKFGRKATCGATSITTSASNGSRRLPRLHRRTRASAVAGTGGAKRPALCLRRGERRQVSEVSTTRRGASRYSSDCISTSRDTVRVNSLESVPSVYSSSAGTSADISSLTLWS
ncbi:hypothetical protein PCO31010_00760 [Pandoraea commovens]|uniref:Uncharacterized protein n=1 Tax=Pandoraea commovens TaxID=2508289 RepID=A0A5E4SEP8_9BURK|nr:hypothetical protein PCO31010_00760 [Pandoraea commovens]